MKGAGVDQATPNDTVYKISTGLSPELMAIKQVVQLGLKMVDFEELGNSRFLIKMKPHDNQRPFWSTFAHQFNRLPLENRKFIHKTYDLSNKASVERVKNHLKCFFTRLQNNGKKSTDSKETARIFKKYRYSKARVEARIAHAEILTSKRKFSTPTGQRNRIESLSNRRVLNAHIIRAPSRKNYLESLHDPCENPPEKVRKSCYSISHRSEITTREIATPQK